MFDLSSSLVYFALFFIVFLPLEQLFAIHKQPVFRQEWLTDCAFMFGQSLFWNGLVVSILVAIHMQLDALPLSGLHRLVQGLPMWLQLIVVIVLSDVCIYWGHRLSHRYDFLWRFHKVHHTAKKLDWIAAFREHPVDNLYTRLIENLPAMLLGFSLQTIAGFVVFRGLWGLFIHSNVKLSVGPLRFLLGCPKLHHWHHDRERNSRCNFANLMPVMDVVFGTFYEPERFPQQYGIDEAGSHSYVYQLLSPLNPISLGKRPTLLLPKAGSGGEKQGEWG